MTTAKYVLLLALAACANAASAQGLSVVSSDPANGAVGVPLDATVEFRLTDPLPAMGTAFTEQVLWSPREALRVNRYGHAQDETGEIRIIFYEVEHQPETDYTFVVHGVRDAAGDVLDRPVVVNYTTAASSGTAVVSGSVSSGSASGGAGGIPPHPVDQTVVLLLRSYGLAEATWDIARADVADGSGAFSIDGVRAGTYWPVAVYFADDDENAPAWYGILDGDGDYVPDSLVVEGDVSGIDFVTNPLFPRSAVDLAPTARQAATSVAQAPELMVVYSGGGPADISGSPDGSAYTWGYSFCSSTDDLLVDVEVTSVDALVFTEEADTDTIETCQRVPVPETFIDSGAAMATAEANGGAAFRAQYTDDEAAVFLTLGDLPLAVRPPAGDVFWTIDYVSPPGVDFAELTVFVDAATGALLEGQPVHAERPDSPDGFELAQNYPNPFNPQTTIAYSLEATARVRLTVFDVQGRAVAQLVDAVREPGMHRVTWDASGHPGGVYWCRLVVGSSVVSRPMVYVK